jgi:hypothetical protein
VRALRRPRDLQDTSIVLRAARAAKIPLIRVEVQSVPDAALAFSNEILAAREGEASAPFDAPELTEAERLQIEEEVARAAKDSVVLWKGRADRGEWDEVKADLEVYRLSGEAVKEDPRRTPEYRQRVIDGLGFGENWKDKRPNFSAQDLAACREVLSRKAAGFWLEDSPRTTLRFVKHDTIPTGPPVCTPPHNLGQEAAQWTDEKLESEVARGQLVRGDSPWGSPPFPVGGNEPAHKKKRKRRLVVDYRRVNARVARSVYYCKRLSDVLGEVAGSVYMTFVDACTGFNQVLNTERAKRVLAGPASSSLLGSRSDEPTVPMILPMSSTGSMPRVEAGVCD